METDQVSGSKERAQPVKKSVKDKLKKEEIRKKKKMSNKEKE